MKITATDDSVLCRFKRVCEEMMIKKDLIYKGKGFSRTKHTYLYVYKVKLISKPASADSDRSIQEERMFECTFHVLQ